MIFALGLLGTLSGVAYAVLGVVAMKHLTEPTEADRAVGWALWWFAEPTRYSPEGRRLCWAGGLLFAAGALCWLAVLVAPQGLSQNGA